MRTPYAAQFSRQRIRNSRKLWLIIDGAFNHERLIEFLQALVRDGTPAQAQAQAQAQEGLPHPGQPGRASLQARKGLAADHRRDIEVFFLPSYSPELYPDERLNADLKQAFGSKVPVRTRAKLRAAADEHMQFIAANRKRVRAYSQDPIVKYAA